MLTLPVDDALLSFRRALAAHKSPCWWRLQALARRRACRWRCSMRPGFPDGKIVQQEPRRWRPCGGGAAHGGDVRAEQAGETVGYRVRLDTRVGPRTRIEVVTDGPVLRMLQDDPSLDGVGCVIFDELHERGLETDRFLRPGARSARRATRRFAGRRDVGDARSRPGGGAAGRRAGGRKRRRMFPVDTIYLDRDPAGRIEDTVASTVRRALAEQPGSALVFLFGVGEIRRRGSASAISARPPTSPALRRPVACRSGSCHRPRPAGRRKVVLATSIAETSLTIEGVRLVIDSG